MSQKSRTLSPLDHDAVYSEIEAQLPALNQFAKRLAGTDADDLVQETVVKALQSSGRYQSGTALKSWLFTIMKNTFCTSYNKRKREVVGFEDSFINKMSIDPPQEWAVLGTELETALNNLGHGSRQSLMLVAWGVSYDETARICDCEIGTVKSRVSRARRILGERFDIAVTS